MRDAVIPFPEGCQFFNVEGMPVVLFPAKPGALPSAIAFEPGKPPRPFPVTSVLRNGSPVDEARFRAIAGLPPMSAALLECDDGIPTLEDDDAAMWDTSAAANAARLATAAIARAVT